MSNFKPPSFFLKVMAPVVAQDVLKRRLAYAFSHYTMFLDDPTLAKPTPLVIGPSGSGKTMSVELCAEATDLPFSPIGAGGVSAAGYKGLTLRDLLSQHYVRFHRSEGVIFLDEIDKWCLAALSKGLEKPDPELVSMGTNKQAELLRYVEREDVWFTEEAKDLGALRQVDDDSVGDDAEEVAWKPVVFETRRTFWVMAGAFDGLHHVIRRRLQQDHMADERDLWEKVAPEDLRRYGMQAELVNRCDVVIWTKPLKGQEMIDILLAQDVPRYVRMFEMIGCRLDLQVSALAQVCELAVQERTGARGASLRLKHVLAELFTEADELALTSATVDAFVMRNGHFPPQPFAVSPQVDGQALGRDEPVLPHPDPLAAVTAV